MFSLFIYCTDIEVACYKYEGVDAVKAALNKGLELSTEDMPIKVRIFILFFSTFSHLSIVDELRYVDTTTILFVLGINLRCLLFLYSKRCFHLLY